MTEARLNKFRAIKTTVDGVTFHSKKEAYRYQSLKLLERGGKILSIELQPEFLVIVNGVKICKYIADFRYLDLATGKYVVEDVKSLGTKTPVYRLKKKLVETLYSISIVEV